MAARIDISSLSLRFSPSAAQALDSLSVTIPEGSCVGVIGPTGAGKTTLLHCLAGILGRHHPGLIVSGHVQIGDIRFEGIPRDILFPGVGLVLQDQFVQISGVRDTVSEEILFTLENTGEAGEGAEARIHSVLCNLGIEHLATRKPTSLSGGETQRVALATILVAQPEVLLLDEPVTALDVAAQAKLRSILRGLKGRTTVLLSDTHIDFPLSACDQILVLDHGRLETSIRPIELLAGTFDLSKISGWDRWDHVKKDLIALLSKGSREASRILKALNLP